MKKKSATNSSQYCCRGVVWWCGGSMRAVCVRALFVGEVHEWRCCSLACSPRSGKATHTEQNLFE